MVLLGTLFAIIFGTLTGVVSAWRRGTGVEGATMTTALGFYSMPTHWLGLMLVILFAGTLPTGGMTNDFLINPSFFTHVKDVGEHMILPALTLGLVLYGEYTLIARSAMLETLGEDYILTARAKGLKPLDDRPAPRAAERDAPDRDADRALARLHRGRRDPDRDGLLVAGHRAGGLRGRAPARLPDARRARSSS